MSTKSTRHLVENAEDIAVTQVVAHDHEVDVAREAWRAFDRASRELERDKEKLLDDIERRLTADIRREPLFTLRRRFV